MTRARHHSRRGLATAFALIMFGVVAAALAAGALLLRNDVLRTRAIRTDAQLRQLLLVGTAKVVSESPDWKNEQKQSVTLPTDRGLQGATLTTQITKVTEAAITVHVVAAMDGRQAEEDVQLHHSGDQWRLADIHLGPVSTTPGHAK